MVVRVAQGLVILSLVLLIIYGVDVSAKETKNEGGFLQLDNMTRGIGFGVPPIILSTAAFFVSMKEKSTLVSVLLLVNGLLIIIGGIMAVRASISVGAIYTSGSGVLGAGIWILALGIMKCIRARAIKTAL